ncbi:Hpt domain-containing protein [Dyella sp.]|uniref:Hpt domain-containing protein n=1 Tax=Dyella sp. TaxID=1869338 RepID=UPI002D788595|nr:Hpt domain-containing protein [Dyella sp.]HET7329640.1 Hpt domain-containing protein [Dyella sp.]
MATSKDFSAVSESQATPVIRRQSALSMDDRRVLIESVTHDLASIDDAWRRRDEAGLLERIHSLKGALFVVGEHATANDCAITELSISSGGLNNCDPDIESLRTSLHRLLDTYGAGR